MGKREVVDKTWKQISKKSQKISHFRAERGNETFFNSFEMCFQVLPSISFFHCLVPVIPLPHASSPAIPLFPMPQAHASSPAHPQAHASSPCQVPASSPCLKPIPLFPSHLSPPCLKSSPPYFRPYSKVPISPYFTLLTLRFPETDPYFVLYCIISTLFRLIYP